MAYAAAWRRPLARGCADGCAGRRRAAAGLAWKFPGSKFRVAHFLFLFLSVPFLPAFSPFSLSLSPFPFHSSLSLSLSPSSFSFRPIPTLGVSLLFLFSFSPLSLDSFFPFLFFNRWGRPSIGRCPSMCAASDYLNILTLLSQPFFLIFG